MDTRTSGEVPGPAVRRRLAQERHAWLCTVRPDGSAHVTPVWFVFSRSVWWVGTDGHAVKVRNVRHEPRVSLTLEDGRFPVVAEGDAGLETTFPPEIVAAFAEKYEWDVTEPTRPGGSRVLLKIRVRRWLLAGSAP